MTNTIGSPEGTSTTEPVEARSRGQWAEWLDSFKSGEDLADDGEPVAEAATVLLDTVAAVDHLRRGLRPSFTVWDALEEALRWHISEESAKTAGALEPGSDDLDADDADPLRTQLQRLVLSLNEMPTSYADETIQRALRRWSAAIARTYNAGYSWPHPIPRRAFPPVA